MDSVETIIPGSPIIVAKQIQQTPNIVINTNITARSPNINSSIVVPSEGSGNNYFLNVTAGSPSINSSIVSPSPSINSSIISPAGSPSINSSIVAPSGGSSKNYFLNVTAQYPLGSDEFYTFSTAIAAIVDKDKYLGLIITYAVENTLWETKRYIGTNLLLNSWINEDNWESFSNILFINDSYFAPYIDETTKTWFQWDNLTSSFINTGIQTDREILLSESEYELLVQNNAVDLTKKYLIYEDDN